MTRDEKFQRKKLRKLIEEKSLVYKDKHGNDTKCLLVSDVMDILLEDKDILELSESIRKPWGWL